MEDLFAFTSKLKVDVQNAVGLIYVFIRNVKIIAPNVLKVNVFVNIKNEKADVQIVRVQRYAHMAIVNIVV
jgi:hypothetical protein